MARNSGKEVELSVLVDVFIVLCYIGRMFYDGSNIVVVGSWNCLAVRRQSLFQFALSCDDVMTARARLGGNPKKLKNNDIWICSLHTSHSYPLRSNEYRNSGYATCTL